MYYDVCTYKRDGRTYRRELLRQSHRVNGKVVKSTVANITDWPETIKAALIAALAANRKGRRSGKVDEANNRAISLVEAIVANSGTGVLRQGRSIGAVAAVLGVAKRLGIQAALGDDRQGRLALFQVLSRVLEQGSRLAAVRQAKGHLGAELLDLKRFNENTLYANLGWLCEHQQRIEDSLFAGRYARTERPKLFLYDVTSSYFEGVANELAAFGYNRDGKRGKKQVVAGLLTDGDGAPLSIELFPGNTGDPSTVPNQLSKLQDRFGGGRLTLVGDRGMLRGPQQKDMQASNINYLTAIGKPQIETLLKAGAIQLELFDEELAEVAAHEDGVRYILRRNPHQVERQRVRRADQLATWERALARENTYLAEHPRATVACAIKRLRTKAIGYRIDAWLDVVAEGRVLSACIDPDAQAEAAKLDGCYVLKTDLPATEADAITLDRRYHDLSKVEWAFRTSKTAHLEMRPIHLRLEDHTRGHAFVVMLAYLIVRHLREAWATIDQTVQEGLAELAQLCVMEVDLPDGSTLREVPRPRDTSARLLEALDLQLPPTVSLPTANVDTKKKLTARRKKR